MKQNEENKKLPSYGGQALIEGVLMRGKDFVVAAFRSPENEIVLESEELQGIYKTKLSKLPLIRGLVILWDSLSLGMKFLTISANIQAAEEDEKIEGGALFFTILISLGFSIGLFFVLPTLLTSLLSRILNLSKIAINLSEGGIRLIILIGYLWVIGLSKDISRVFQYHGAEHKTINAFESGIDLSIEKIKKFPLAHTRCGTSFLLTLVILSIFVFSILGPMNIWMRILARVLFVPVLAMLSYEIIKWMGDHQENVIVKLMTAPNLFLQNLTTREPDDSQIEIALAAFNKLLAMEQYDI